MARYNSRKVGRTAAFGKTDGMKQFAQDQGAASYGLQAKRGMAAKAGDMGEPQIVGAYRGKKAVQGFASVIKGVDADRRKYGGAARAKKHYQKPAASNRQYNFPALAPIPQQGK